MHTRFEVTKTVFDACDVLLLIHSACVNTSCSLCFHQHVEHVLEIRLAISPGSYPACDQKLEHTTHKPSRAPTMASHVTVVTFTIAVVASLAWGPSTVHCDHLFAKTAKENEHLALEAICKGGRGVDKTSVIITQVLTPPCACLTQTQAH